MISNFNPKIGQLVSWKMSGPNSVDEKEHLGIITDMISDNFVEVTFLHRDWIITLSCKGLKLINDVEKGS